MADDYARTLARVAASQLAEVSGYESAQESAIEILADLLLHYLSEVSTGANAYAALATRSDINAQDVALSVEDLGASVDELRAYAQSLSSDDNTFAHVVPAFPVRRTPRPVPSFDDKGELPPVHVPPFLPAFPDPHTFEHTPAFPGHELNPQKQTEVVQQQRRAAEKALVQLHKRTKVAVAGSGGDGGGDSKPAGKAGKAAAKAVQAKSAAARKEEAAVAAVDPSSNPFLKQPHFELAHSWQARGGSGAATSSSAAAAGPSGDAVAAADGVVAVPEQLLLGTCPHHVVFDLDLVVRQLGPALEGALPGMQLDTTKLTDAFRVIHPSMSRPADNGLSQARQQQQQQQQPVDAAFFSRNPFRTFVLQPQQQQQQQQGGGTLQLQGHIVPARLRLKKRPLPGVPQGPGAQPAGAAQRAAAGAQDGAGTSGRGEAAAAAEARETARKLLDATSSAVDVLLFLAAPRTASDQELEASDREAEAQLRSQAEERRRQQAMGVGGPEGALGPAAAAAAFKALAGGDGDVAWKCSTAFEEGGGSLKPTFAAGFSQDWATATQRAALSLASRREQTDAYSQIYKPI